MARNILAIDPGNEYSAFVEMDQGYKPIRFAKLPNDKMRSVVAEAKEFGCTVVIEMIGHYGSGMPAGTTVFDTCIWIGRFTEIAGAVTFIKRKTIAAEICGTVKAKDSNVRQALIDRFAPGISNYGKGTKKDPGWFYGFSADVWQAYAVGVTYLDKMHRTEGCCGKLPELQ